MSYLAEGHTWVRSQNWIWTRAGWHQTSVSKASQHFCTHWKCILGFTQGWGVLCLKFAFCQLYQESCMETWANCVSDLFQWSFRAFHGLVTRTAAGSLAPTSGSAGHPSVPDHSPPGRRHQPWSLSIRAKKNCISWSHELFVPGPTLLPDLLQEKIEFESVGLPS